MKVMTCCSSRSLIALDSLSTYRPEIELLHYLFGCLLETDFWASKPNDQHESVLREEFAVHTWFAFNASATYLIPSSLIRLFFRSSVVIVCTTWRGWCWAVRIDRSSDLVDRERIGQKSHSSITYLVALHEQSSDGLKQGDGSDSVS